MYIPLYVKTNYSFLSSLVKIDDLIKKCVTNNIDSLAITDDNMIATLLFYNKCKENNIKPILGMEFIYNKKSLLVYAKNYDGYKNLIKLFSIGNILSKENLDEYKNNLIYILPYGGIENFKELNLFINNLYIGYSNKDEEIQSNNITPNTVFINKLLYINKRDSKYYKYSIMMKEKKNVMDDIDYIDKYNYLLSENELNLLSSKKGIENTKKIANEVNIEFPKYENLIPEYKNNYGISSNEYLLKLSIQGLTIRLNNNVTEEYKKRLLYELDVINKMGFSDYFLIVYDYVKYAKKSKILVGPGRGSAGGSLVAYALGIIDVDPIKYNLLFERFLNPGRVTMPDIDIDFPDIYRSQVIDYIKDKYGIKKVAGIIAIGTLKAKAVLDDVSKVLKISNDKVDRIKNYFDLNMTLKDAYDKNDELKQIIDNDDNLSKLYEIASFFEGFPKNTTTHASGIIISRVDLDEIIPIIKQDDMYISSYEMGYLEPLGLLKMDFLGNRNLTTIMDILNNINDKEERIDFLNIPLDDRETLNIFYNVDTNGIFQFDTNAMKNLLTKLKVKSFDDVVACNSLVRPGPDTKEYLERRNGNKKINYLNDKLKNILEPTYGVLVYQEQIMQIANIMANFTLSEADTLRRAMSKKKASVLKIYEEKFIKESLDNGYSYEEVKEVYDSILPFASYGFNKSHAVAYSIIAYKMAYLKAHYPKYFYISILSMMIGNSNETASIIREARSRGVKFILPNINASTDKFEITEEGIILPLSNIRNIGINTAQEIMKIRKEGFKDIFECFTKLQETSINSKMIESLIYASCFDTFGYNKNTLLNNIDNLLNYAYITKGLESSIIEHPEIKKYDELDNSILMSKEKELFGFYLSNHPTSIFKEQYKVTNLKDVSKNMNKIVDVIGMVDRIKAHQDKRGNTMAFINISDEEFQLDLTLFSDIYKQNSMIKKGNIILVEGKVDFKNEYQIIVEKIKILS